MIADPESRTGGNAQPMSALGYRGASLPKPQAACITRYSTVSLLLCNKRRVQINCKLF